MKTEEIVRLAKELVDRSNRAGWEYDLGPPERESKGSTRWRFNVQLIPPKGTTYDSLTIVVVDEDEGRAWFWE